MLLRKLRDTLVNGLRSVDVVSKKTALMCSFHQSTLSVVYKEKCQSRMSFTFLSESHLYKLNLEARENYFIIVIKLLNRNATQKCITFRRSECTNIMI